MEKAVFGASGFFSEEAFLTDFRGIEEVQIRQIKGTNLDIVEIWYNPWKVTYHELLDLFFDLHDPTSSSSQSNENQSFVYFSNKYQYELAKQKKSELKGVFRNKIITKITPASQLKFAEEKLQYIS